MIEFLSVAPLLYSSSKRNNSFFSAFSAIFLKQTKKGINQPDAA